MSSIRMAKRVYPSLCLLLGLGFFSGGRAAAEDKSATREGLVKLPGSGGTVQKDDSSFDFSASRGTASYSVPLPELPTRGGMKPELTLQYNQSAGDGGGGLGIGWTLSSSSIGFNDDLGTALHQKRFDNEDFSSHLALDGQRLIPHLSNKSGQDYQYSLESSSASVKVRYTKQTTNVEYLGKNGETLNYAFPGGFIVTAANGQKAYYAEQPSSAELDPDHPDHVVRWPLTAEFNPQKEAIFYSYTKFANRSYLHDVSFAGGQSVYQFELIKTRASMVSHKAAFPQANSMLLGGITASFRQELQSQVCLAYIGRGQNSDAFAVRAGQACLQRAQTDLAPLINSTNVRSLNVLDQLRTIYRFGRGTQVSDGNMLPKISFDYSNWNESDNQRNIIFPAKSLAQTTAVTQFELFDYNLDALVDLIQVDNLSVKIALGTDNLDTSFSKSVPWTLERDGVAIKPLLKSPAWHFVEMNGDSLTDLVEVGQGQIHVYLRTGTGSFAPAVTLDIPWINPGLFATHGLRWVDLNSDGLTDLLGTEIQGNENVWKMAINQTVRTPDGFDYYFLETTQKMPYKAPLSDILTDEAILLTDVNGDQLIDLVRVRGDRSGICIYENQGDVYADSNAMLFGAKGQDVLSTTNCDSGRFVQVDGLSAQLQNGSRRIWFMDANGDGILDLTSFNGDDSEMRVWLGFGNGDFLQNPLRFSTLDKGGKPQISVQSGRERTRIADIDGDGQAELVIFQPGIPGLKPVVVIDFNRLATTQLVKSNLLTTIENGTGLRHDLRYASSIDELVRDRAQNLSTRALHFPMYVVKQLVISEADPLNPGHYKDGHEVKEMLYHQPIYDPRAKKLVGFQTVETITYGDEFKGPQDMTQLSSYHREVFADDYRLAGRLQESYIHEYTPAGTFEVESEQSDNLAMNDITVHSMKTYTQGQEAAAPGRMLSSTRYRWDLVSKVEGYDGESAYFVRQLAEENLYYGSGGTSSAIRKAFTAFDDYNIPSIIDETRDAIQGPEGITIPSRSTRQVITFEPARSQLASLDIVSAPSKVEDFKLDGTLQTLIAASQFEYSTLGQLKKQTESALYDKLRVKPDVKAPRDRVSEKTYDVFGNPLTSSTNGVLVESVSYDATGTFPIGLRNAIGQATRLYYGADSMDTCRQLAPANVQEGLLKGYQDTRGVCHAFSYDQFARRTVYQRDDGYEERYQYHFAEGGAPSRILKTMRRYLSTATRPAGELEWVVSLEAWTPAGAKVAALEVLEEGEGVRVMSYEEHNRKKNTVRVYTPYKDLTTSLSQIFTSGIIPTAGKEAFTLTSYDALNRPVQRIYPTGRIEHHRFEPWGQVQTSTYDKGDNQGTATVNKTLVQLGNQVFGIVDARGGIFRYVYDIYDNISEVRLPGQAQPRAYVYSSLDQKLQQCMPETGCSLFEYDQLGQLAVRTNYDAVGKKTSTLQYFFDVLGRLQELSENGRLAARNKYDSYPTTTVSTGFASATGLLTVSQSFDENHLYDETKVIFYDKAGRTVERRTELNGAQLRSFVEKFQFTLDGALQQAEDPFHVKSYYRLSPTLRFTHLDMELPWQVGSRETIVDKVTYNAKGQVEQIAYRKGSYTNLAYDPQTLLLTQIESSYKKADGNQEFLQYASLDFDGNGSVVSIDDKVSATTSYGQINRSAKFAYNERDELVHAERYGETQTFNYDLAGNFTQNTELGSNLVPNSRPLLPPSSQDTTYEFDRSGQLKSRKSTAVVRSSDPLQDLQKRRQILETRFNGLGHLIYLKTDKQEIFFGYSADGIRNYKRVKEINGSRVADSLFPSKSVIVEPTGSQSFVLIGDRRIARIEHAPDLVSKGQWYYYILDHLGSTDFTMQADGTPVEQMLYRAYGTEVDIIDATHGAAWKQHQQAHQSLMPRERTHHRYTGQYLDDDSGLYYYGTRYYDPLLGRFISPDDTFVDDPENCIERPVECNAYGYAANNPVKYSDPTGKWAHIVIGAVIGAVIGGAADAIFNPNSNWKTVAAAAGGGAVSGALAAATGGASLAAQSTVTGLAIGAGVGAVSAGVGNTVQQGINIATGEQKSFSGRQLGTSVVIGGVAGAAGTAVARAIRAPVTGGLCFAKGTLISTPMGLVPIEDIQEGDDVYAYDVLTDTPTLRKVTASLRGKTGSWIDIQVNGEEIVRATPSHPIWLPIERRWIAAEKLVPGQTLLTLEGRLAKVTSVQRKKLSIDEDTYNFSVEKDADYFVGKTHVLVHNNTPPSLPDKVLFYEEGVRIWHNYGNNTAAPPGTPIEHRPIHYHASYKGVEYELQASGEPMRGAARPPQAVLDVMKERRSFFNRMDGRISQWLNRVASGPKGGKCG